MAPGLQGPSTFLRLAAGPRMDWKAVTASICVNAVSPSAFVTGLRVPLICSLAQSLKQSLLVTGAGVRGSRVSISVSGAEGFLLHSFPSFFHSCFRRRSPSCEPVSFAESELSKSDDSPSFFAQVLGGFHDRRAFCERGSVGSWAWN
jgi:hypothetical protein